MRFASLILALSFAGCGNPSVVVPSSSPSVTEVKPFSNVECMVPTTVATSAVAANIEAAPTKAKPPTSTKVTWKQVTEEFAEIEPVRFKTAKAEAYEIRQSALDSLSGKPPTTPAEGRAWDAKAAATTEAGIDMMAEAAGLGDLYIFGTGDARKAMNAIMALGARKFIKAIHVRATYRSSWRNGDTQAKAEQLWNQRPKVANTPKAIEAEAEWLYTFLATVGD
jgi:hypothetical protein